MAFNDEILARAGSSWDDPEPLDMSVFEGSTGEELKRRAAEKLLEEFGDADTVVIKDPRICRFYPFWREVIVGAGYEPFVVIPVREPHEVAASLNGRNGMTIEDGLALWRRHVEEAEISSRAQSRCVLIWRDLLEDWRGAVAHIEYELKCKLQGDDAQIEAFLNPAESLHFGRSHAAPDAVTMALFDRMKALAAHQEKNSRLI